MEIRVEAPASWYLSRRLFLAGIAGTYAVAFGSLLVQVRGLFGARGIAPLAERMQALGAELEGWERWQLPTLFWFGASDARLALACWLGLALALCALAGFVSRLALLGCWVLYLSLVCVGWPFLSFQWDVLLLEAGLLAVVWAPGGMRLGRGERAPPRATRWLVYWLLFRLMVLSGAVKLRSGDPAWRDGTALDFHFWTQPLPHRLSVYAHELPAGLRHASVAVMFALELGMPCLLLVPWERRRLRQVVAGAVVLLMALISATGNYGFFNLLTCVLCVPLLDDRAWCALLRRPAPSARAAADPIPSRLRVGALASFAGLAVLLTTARGLERLGWIEALPGPLAALERAAAPLASFNAYGLFSVMTKERPQLEIEGSADGLEWREYGLRYQAGALDRPPAFAGLHMPRLDWQLWFAGLEHDGPVRSSWTRAFLRRLLEGSPEVLGLLAVNPFPDGPPRQVRAQVALYRFASTEERRSGTWWQRGEWRSFLPVERR
jgi:hypothetical protein